MEASGAACAAAGGVGHAGGDHGSRLKGGKSGGGHLRRLGWEQRELRGGERGVHLDERLEGEVILLLRRGAEAAEQLGGQLQQRRRHLREQLGALGVLLGPPREERGEQLARLVAHRGDGGLRQGAGAVGRRGPGWRGRRRGSRRWRR